MELKRDNEEPSNTGKFLTLDLGRSYTNSVRVVAISNELPTEPVAKGN